MPARFQASRFYSFLLAMTLLIWLITAFAKGSLAGEYQLDLRQVQLTKGISIDGDWEFYWRKLLDPTQPINTNPDLIAKLNSWNKYTLNGNRLPAEGFGTYRKIVLIDEDIDHVGLRIPYMDTAYVLFINGKKISSNGQVARRADESVPQYRVAYLAVDASATLEIVVHVSNYEHVRGGINRPIKIFLPAELMQKEMKRHLFVYVFLVGILMFVGFYHLVLYLASRNDPENLYLGLYSILSATGILFGSRELYSFYQPVTISWEFQYKLLLSLICLEMLTLLHFFRSIYPQVFSRIINRVFYSVFTLFIVILILSDSSVFLTIRPYAALFSLGLLIYIFYELLNATIKKLPYSRHFLLGFAIILTMFAIDLIAMNVRTESQYLMPIGNCIFMIFQATVLALKFSSSFREVETLSKDLQLSSMELDRKNVQLKEYGDKLEGIVQERTEALNNTLLEVSKAKDEAVQANNAKTDFLANISHELRTPMHGILGFAKLGLEKAAGTSRLKLISYFNQISQSGEKLFQLLNDLLDLSKLEAGHGDYEFQNHSLSRIVETVINELQAAIDDKQLQLDFEKPDFPDQAWIDIEKIEQVVRNLLSNALKFSKPNGRIQFKIQNLNSDYQITVSDEGFGIPEDEIDMIFDKFVQSTRTKTGAGGTGLGLSICKRIVEDHKGSIMAVNNDRGGADLIFTIPKG
jgi:signal transduction histidine kinase